VPDCIQRGLCDGFVVGLAELFGDDQRAAWERLCFPTGVARRQVIDVVVRHLDLHPEDRASPRFPLQQRLI
jgi:hypothetical protein